MTTNKIKILIYIAAFILTAIVSTLGTLYYIQSDYIKKVNELHRVNDTLQEEVIKLKLEKVSLTEHIFQLEEKAASIGPGYIKQIETIKVIKTPAELDSLYNYYLHKEADLDSIYKIKLLQNDKGNINNNTGF